MSETMHEREETFTEQEALAARFHNRQERLADLVADAQEDSEEEARLLAEVKLAIRRARRA